MQLSEAKNVTSQGGKKSQHFEGKKKATFRRQKRNFSKAKTATFPRQKRQLFEGKKVTFGPL